MKASRSLLHALSLLLDRIIAAACPCRGAVRTNAGIRIGAAVVATAVTLIGIDALPASAQAPSTPTVVSVPPASAPANPIAIVPLDTRLPGSAAIVTGALQVIGGRAFIAANGTITSGATTTDVSLPGRGSLQVCAATAVKLAADSSTPAGEKPGLLMAMDHGAVEASFSTGRNADMILTPDFRILISAPGTANVKVRLGQGGDTCVDNPGTSAPYVLVTSVFDSSVYRVQPGQRVMFQHGSVHEVVDQEKEPCGCPPAEVKGNDFPLAQSEGIAPLPPATPIPAAHGTAKSTPAPAQPLVYNAGEPPPATATEPPSDSAQEHAPAAKQTAPHKHSGVFSRIGHFFRRLFGAE